MKGQVQMLQESKLLLDRYDHYFTREPNTRYWLVIVNNHYDQMYGFFLYSQKGQEVTVYSHELLALPFSQDLYSQVYRDLQDHSDLPVEYRDTDDLVENVPAVEFDPLHGHRHSTVYLPEDKNSHEN
ncbi:hypothetical protein [Schleiferilactobacillus perolens]|jgi:hypothetical protein|uniref:hypothetical protein n=1 Tax=Schleiferilactobacillus perolens TaxID=100468 RepID=UPI002352C1D5|nr:hypothetical protein [Schleiferilactobacillus perolens]MCI2172530.1 hypothetical protein [Schleiferilactobacillus perolens]